MELAMKVCPTCGAPLRTKGRVNGWPYRRRHAVLLPKGLTQLYDIIARHESGILCEWLASILYPDDEPRTAAKKVAVRVSQLNDRLEEADIKVKGGRGQPYRLVRR